MTNLTDEAYCIASNFHCANDLGNWLQKLVKCLDISVEGGSNEVEVNLYVVLTVAQCMVGPGWGPTAACKAN
jgi:hypothetical protein